MPWEFSDPHKAWIANWQGKKVEDIDWNGMGQMDAAQKQHVKAQLLPEMGPARSEEFIHMMQHPNPDTLSLIVEVQKLSTDALTQLQYTNPEAFKIISQPWSSLDPALKQRYPSLNDFDARCQFLRDNVGGDWAERFTQFWRPVNHARALQKLGGAREMQKL